jgi:hypothetical protein
MEGLFLDWAKRENVSENNSTDKSTTKNKEEIDKNSKMLLKSILITHKKYMKEEVPAEYVYDDELKDFKKIDVTKEITPFATNKDNLYDRLEADREEYLSKKQDNTST